MQKYQEIVLKQNGTPLQGATITVTDTMGGAVSVYSSNAVGVNVNPLTTDSMGRFGFYAADGRYNLVVSFSGVTLAIITDILLEDPANPNAYTINGGSIDNTPIGNTTRSTGKFTTVDTTTPISLASGGTGGTDAATARAAMSAAQSGDNNDVTRARALTQIDNGFGVGVAAKAHGASYDFIDFGNYTSLGQQIGGTSGAMWGWNVTGGASLNSFVYSRTGDVARLIEMDTGGLKVYMAPSGIAGNPITFTQVMTVDGTGRWGLGTTPAYAVDVADVAGGSMFRYTRGPTQFAHYISADTPHIGSLTNHRVAVVVNSTERASFGTDGILSVPAGILVGGATTNAALDGVSGLVAGAESGASGGIAFQALGSAWVLYTTSSANELLFYNSTTNQIVARFDAAGRLRAPAGIVVAPVAFASLPASPVAGQRAMINNSPAAPAFLSAATGGGSTTVPVFFNGTAWLVG
jgi:hypothetical protein